MNYQEKAWAIHRGRPLIRHVLDRISPQVTHVIISRNRPDPRYDDLPYTCLADDSDRFDGPLAGIATCISMVTTPLTLVVPCDTPNLPADLVDRLNVGLQQADICIATDEQRDQPLIMLAKSGSLDSTSDYLATGGRSVTGWLDTHRIERVRFSAPLLANINEASQLE